MQRSGQVIEARLTELRNAGTVEEFVRHDYPGARPQQLFDALWRPEKGVVVRGRLVLAPFDGLMSPWELIAEATRNWDWSWPSPASMFWPKSRDSAWDAVGAYGALAYRTTTFIDSPETALSGVRDALDAQADIHVLTTDDEPGHPAHQLVPLVRYLPAGFTGRVIEQRVSPSAVTAVNRALAPAGLRLPPQGALIVPQRSLLSRTDTADLVIPSARFSQGRPQALVEALVRHATVPRQTGPGQHRHVELLRTQFSVMPDEEVIDELEEDLKTAETKLTAALQDAENLRTALHKTTALLRESKQESQARSSELEQARQAIKESRTALAEASAAHGQLLDSVQNSDMGTALRDAEARRDAAESEAEAAEELLDEQAREIAWLRTRLAAAGQLAPEVAPPTAYPSSWENLAERCAVELERIVLGDILATSRPLRGHTSETTWLRRTWEALRALDAYARAKSKHGPEVLPHLSAYLSWRDAAVALPRSRYSANESQLVLTTPKLRDERLLPVPRDVDPSGRALMAEHIRIGSGRPPAPRLHFHDHTAGNGRIYVGHIGPHLRNSHTN
ncbi:hypothetical protein AB0F20_10230 [Streptomyces goshikiensis]|uniref:hypothetical protein n=1 Tax=Streptomyces goshikiensis TaxID=1942 RepID=UPI0033C4D17C